MNKVSAKQKNNIVKAPEKEDELSQWLGVYCPHYQRFYCTGESEGCKTGCCATPEDYHTSMAENMGVLK